MHAYFDESGTHDGSPVMCVAGYLFPPGQAKKFNREWDAVLRAEGLAYFRKSECESGRGQFKGIPMQRRIEIERKLIALIAERALFGGAAVMSQMEFDAMAPAGWHEFYGSAYTACLHLCVAQMVEWMVKENYPGPVSYFFEGGHQKSGEAHIRLSTIASDKVLAEDWMYASHKFADKRVSRPCDAADFLAWHIRHYYIESILTTGTAQRRAIRKDLAALLEGRIQRGLYKVWMIKDGSLSRYFESQQPPPLPVDRQEDRA